MKETIEESYECLVCREEWSIEHYLEDYEYDILYTDHICVMCGGSMIDALKNKKDYEEATKLELIYYILKRIINKTLLKIRLK